MASRTVPAPRPPFQAVPFTELPEEPHRPHAWHRARGETVVVESAPFGRLAVHHRLMGEGPPLLLVHGLMTTSYSWRYVLEPLAEHFSVLAPDLPGCGRTTRPSGRPFAPGALATFITEYQRAAGIEGCLAIGNSMGGYLCMQAALAHPGTFSRLVNMHSPGIPEPRLHALGLASRIPGALALFQAVVRRDPLRFAHRNVHYRDETLKSLEEAREYGGVLADPEGLRCFVRYLTETMAPGPMAAFVATLERERRAGRPFPVPLMLLYATTDPLVSPQVGEKLGALIPSAELQWLHRTSHFAHVDTPEAVLERVLPFLRRPAAAST